MSKRLLSGGLLCLGLALSACVSIDSHIQSETVDSVATQSISGSFANRAIYWSGTFPASEMLSDMLGTSASADGVVRVSLASDGTLVLKWFIGDVEEASREFSPERITIAADGAIELRTESSVEKIGTFADYQTWLVRIFINSHGELVLVKSFMEGGVGFLVIVPVALGSYSKQLAVFPRKN